MAIKIPPKLIAFNLTGALLVAVGMLNIRQGNDDAGISYAALGLLLMLPLIVHIFKNIPSGRD